MEENKFTRAAMISVLVTNDLHYMHLLSKGVDFDKSHNLAQDYYEKMGEDMDYLMELALEVGATVYNFTKAGEIIPEYQPEDKPAYDYPTIIECIRAKLGTYIQSLMELREAAGTTDIESRLDDMIREWKKELDYRLARRSATNFSNTFINTGLDARITGVYGKNPINE